MVDTQFIDDLPVDLPIKNGIFSIVMLVVDLALWKIWLYTGWWCNNHLEKYEFVNGKDDIPYILENKKCLKPPTSQFIDDLPIEESGW